MALISLGIMVLSFGAGASRAAVGFALATGASVAAYSFLAGMGVRSGGTVLGFQAWLEIVNGVRHGGLRAADAARGVHRLCPHVMPPPGCWRACCRSWASSPISPRPSSLPLGPVTALRETSVIFGAVIGTVVLKEGFGLRRIAAATMVVLGIALLAFWR